MRTFILASGSKGNCVYVESGDCRLLIDAGISGRQAEQRLAAHGRDIRKVDALLISHDHADHVKSAGTYHRKFGMPVYATHTTFETALQRHRLGRIDRIQTFRSGETLSIGSLRIETVPTPHDGVDGVGFVIDDQQQRLGVLTDLGHVFSQLDAVLQSLDSVILESNHDEQMLHNGPYPEYLKRRIRGHGGHISNREAAELVCRSGDRLKAVCLAHLSEENNCPELAWSTFREVNGESKQLFVATQQGMPSSEQAREMEQV